MSYTGNYYLHDNSSQASWRQETSTAATVLLRMRRQERGRGKERARVGGGLSGGEDPHSVVDTTDSPWTPALPGHRRSSFGA
jgi:hypothetical protein